MNSEAADEQPQRGQGQRVKGSWQSCLLLHWLPLLLGLSVLGSLNWQVQEHLLEQNNHKLFKHDQAANMRLSREIYWMRQSVSSEEGLGLWIQSRTPAYTDGVINPLWPWIASFLPEMEAFAERVEDGEGLRVKEAQSAEGVALFEAGKRFNARFTWGFLLLLGVVLGFRWHWLSVLNFLALASLAAFLPRGGYFQPEPLSYTLSLVAWILALESILGKARWWLLALLGVILGLSWLAKSSALLLLVGFVGIFTWRLLRDFLLKKKWPLQALLGLGLLLVAFAAVIAPRFAFAQERYAQGFWSYPSAWMWFDHFDPGYDWMVEHSGATFKGEEPPAPPASGLGEWLERHSHAEFAKRLSGGTWQRIEEMFTPKATRWKKGQPKLPWRNLLDHRGVWLLGVLGGFCLLVVLGLCWRSRVDLTQELSTGKQADSSPPKGEEVAQAEAICCTSRLRMVMLFALGTLGVWLLSLGWYWPIANFAERFVLILYALLAYLLFWLLEKVRKWPLAKKGAKSIKQGVWLGSFWLLQASLLVALLIRYSHLLRWPEFS